MIISLIFLVLMWGGFYWLATNAYVEMASLQLISIILITILSVAEYEIQIIKYPFYSSSYSSLIERKCRFNWALLIYIFILLVVFIIGCYLLSGSSSFAEFINKYFVDVILKRQL